MNTIKNICLILLVVLATSAWAGNDPLPSWNEGPAKQGILNFIKQTTEPGSPNFVPPDQRIATFDQDGTLWEEYPIYTFLRYSRDGLPAAIAKNPALAAVEPFKTALANEATFLATLPFPELAKILFATLTGMTIEQYDDGVRNWLATTRNPRWHRPFTDLFYQPMLEVLRYFRLNGYKTYIVTGGDQDFVRVYSEAVYGVPPEQIVGTAPTTEFGIDSNGKAVLTRQSQLMIYTNFGGKAEGIHLNVGRRPVAAFGNSTGDQQMLEYAKSGPGLRLAMLVLHDDATREYAYGPAQGLPQTNVGLFTQDLYNEATKSGWFVISMKNDWKQVFSFDSAKP